MKTETLQRALTAVRQLIVVADRNVSDWRDRRDRRRRQEAAFLRGIVRAEGSQRKAAVSTGISQSTISRTLDPEGHEKRREDQAERDARNRNLASPQPTTPENNVVPLRKRRPDWTPREPQLREIDKWYQQYLGWTKTAQQTARQLVFTSKGVLPNDAYYPTEPRPSDGNRALGQQKRSGKSGVA